MVTPGDDRAVDATAVWAAAATSLAIIAQQVAGKAIRDALFLSSFGATSLPLMLAAGAVLSLVASLLLARSLLRHSPATLMPLLSAVSAIGLVAEWVLGLFSPQLSAIAVHLHMALLGPALLTTFWSLINERFDPHSARKAVAKIAAGGTAGGVVGGLAAWGVSVFVEPPLLLLVLAGLSASCVAGSLWIRKEEPALVPLSGTDAAADDASTDGPLTVLWRTPFLRNVALLVVLGSVMGAVLDYVFAAEASAAFAKGQPLLAFFSLFWLGVAVISFLLQIVFGQAALRLGLAINLAFLPVLVIGGATLSIAVPGLQSIALLRGLEAVQRNTLFRSAYELLYAPLSEQRKRITKSVIDIGLDRFGVIAGSGVVFVLVHVLPEHAWLLLAAIAGIAVLSLWVTKQLHTGYVAALEEGLRERAEQLDPEPEHTSLNTKSEIAAREELLQRVEELKPGAGGPASRALEQPDPILRDAAELLSGDVDRVRAVLKDWSAEKLPLASIAVLLLAHKELYFDVEKALMRTASKDSGLLVDTMLNPEMDFIVRRRIPRVLAACPSQRAADGLLLGMTDERFEVRYACGRSLRKLAAERPDIVISRDQVMSAINYELEKAKSPNRVAFEELDDDAADERAHELAELLLRDRFDRGLKHIFTILSLHLDRDALRLALRALHHEDLHHRGTALEYLSTVLPPDIRDALWPLLDEATPLSSARSAEEVLIELRKLPGGSEP